MKKMMLLIAALAAVIILHAQGINQLWGVTYLGGINDNGVIFSTDAEGNGYNVRYNFKFDTIGGSSPASSLTQYGGKLYGITQLGGLSGDGVIFEFDPATNIYTKKFDFNNSDGTGSSSQLILNGTKLYGMTQHGGANNIGVIFEWDPMTNVYTKKIDFGGTIGSRPVGSLALNDGKFYGATIEGGAQGFGVIFEWDPVTNLYTKKIDFDNINGSGPHDLAFLGGKFYGMTTYGGINNTGVIFEWDPVTNIYSKRIDFTGVNGSFPMGGPSADSGKFYGMTNQGGNNNLGVIFEWDPITNIYTKKIDFDGNNGSDPAGSLTLNNGKFYGMAAGDFDNGSLFEWDPSTNIFIKKKDLGSTHGIDGYVSISNLTVVQAPIASGLPGNCVSYSSVTIDNSNNNKWVSITDASGNAVAEIKANGNNLGIVSTSIYINNAAVREDSNKKLYLDRNITVTPALQPSSAVDIRLYIKGSELQALKNAINSNGDSPGISGINDLAIYKNEDNCSPVVLMPLADPLSSTAETWQDDYVLSASIPSFSSFYFANKSQACPAPVIQCNADTVVDATPGRCGTVVHYEQSIVTDACGIATVKQTAGLHSGAFFPVGITTNKFIATDPSGQKDSCSFTVTVKDNKPPFITSVLAYPALLWPPDHKMKNVGVNYFAWDNCGATSCSLDVKSDEPLLGTGYGDKAPDWKILGPHHVELRAERSGHGNGRIYTITVTCTDASGNTATQNTRVFVPRELHGRLPKGFDEENGDYREGKGDYFDKLFSCKVSPNPSAQNFNLEIESVSDEKIEVNLYDIAGRFISKLSAVKNNTFLFGDNLRPGMYMIEVKQGQQKQVLKIIKQ